MYLRSMLDSLYRQKCIYVNLKYPRWDWNLDRIKKLELSQTVLDLLSKEMRKLQSELQLGLKVTSCMGSTVSCPTLDILSNDLGVNLRDTFLQLSEKGYIKNEVNGFRFVHDKVQQASLCLFENEEQQRKSHMRFGLAILASTGTEDDNNLFLAMAQINRGGPSVLLDPRQRQMVAALNLRAGKRAISLDYISGLQLFEFGISFLGQDHWRMQYELTLKLFDSAAEAACVNNQVDKVKIYADEVFEKAQSRDDKIKCGYACDLSRLFWIPHV